MRYASIVGELPRTFPLQRKRSFGGISSRHGGPYLGGDAGQETVGNLPTLLMFIFFVRGCGGIAELFFGQSALVGFRTSYQKQSCPKHAFAPVP